MDKTIIATGVTHLYTKGVKNVEIFGFPLYEIVRLSYFRFLEQQNKKLLLSKEEMICDMIFNVFHRL